MSTNREIKFRYVCKDLSGQLFFIYKNITDFLNAGMNSHGRIQKIIAVNQFTGFIDSEMEDIYNDDIVDIGQTVNGQSRFVINACVPKLDIRYAYDLNRKYEYDAYDLMTCEDIKVIGNVHTDPSLLKS